MLRYLAHKILIVIFQIFVKSDPNVENFRQEIYKNIRSVIEDRSSWRRSFFSNFHGELKRSRSF